MAKRPEEILAELQKQKEDIEILLSSLEEAYSEAGITEKHYKEVKTKNQKKLKDIERKIKRIEKKVGKRAKVEAKEPKTVGEMIEAEQGPVPVSKPLEGEMPAEPPTEPPAEMPKPTPVGAPPVAKPGKEKFSADDIKNMLSRFIKEIKPGGLEVLPKVEKMEVRLEKMNAFLTAIKDEKTSGDETIRRLTEEIGEIRSNIGALDRKTSQQEILVTEINTAITDLKPQKFVKFLRKEDTQVKMHDAKIQKIEDVTSLLIKRIAQVEEVLKKIGSLEKIADFGRNIAKRLVEIENREKRIGRISDRIDSIFMELNKRLDEFMLYKAKQDTLDELSREMMKAIDEMNTKVEGFAKKEDLDLLRDTLESRISGAGVVAPATSPEVMKLQEQKSEIEGLLGILEEQFKKGDLKKEEYEKAKKVNTERMERIDKKIQEKSQVALVGVPAPVEEPAGQPAQEPVKEEKPTEEKPGAEKEKPAEEKKTAETPPAAPLEEKKPAEKPVEKPVEKKVVKKPLEEKKPVGEKKPAKGRKDQMLEELEESYKKGEISKEAYEKTKKMIEGGK